MGPIYGEMEVFLVDFTVDEPRISHKQKILHTFWINKELNKHIVEYLVRLRVNIDFNRIEKATYLLVVQRLDGQLNLGLSRHNVQALRLCRINHHLQLLIQDDDDILDRHQNVALYVKAV